MRIGARTPRLFTAISAVAACVVLTYAQFGWQAGTRQEVFSFFDLQTLPRWTADERYYTHPDIPWGLTGYFQAS